MHPLVGGEAPVPAQQRVGRDDETRQHPARQELGEAGEHGTVGFGERWACHVAVQDGDLVAEGDDFGFERAARLRSDQEQANDGDEQPVEDWAEVHCKAVAGGGGMHR